MPRGFASAVAACLVLAPLPSAAQADPTLVAEGTAIASGESVPAEVACSRCHGIGGAGSPELGAPRIAGQSWLYLRKQLADFAAGWRPSTVMAPVARALKPEQWLAVSAYYELQRMTPWPAQPYPDPALLQTGAAISGAGIRGVRACVTCHAGEGKGLPPSYPYLAGQYPAYTVRQMLLWKDGFRRNDPLDAMREIASAMTEEEIRAVAAYFGRVRPALGSINRAEPDEPIPAGSPAEPPS